jgi:hypothetical protein
MKRDADKGTQQRMTRAREAYERAAKIGEQRVAAWDAAAAIERRAELA